MGAQGTDILLSDAALKLFPYAVECKNQEAAKTIYDWYAQAKDNSQPIGENGHMPLLIIKRNHHEPLAIVDAEYFVRMHKDGRQT
jgi:hypothetical protein